MSIAQTQPIPTYPEPGESSTFEVTYDDYMAMPECNQHVEIVDGVIFVMGGPTVRHQRVVFNLLMALSSPLRLGERGVLLMAPCDVIIRKKPKLRVRQPDLMFFDNATAGFDTRVELDRLQEAIYDCTLAPLLVAEVLSPGQNERTLAGKLADYASIEIEEVWFVDQDAKSVRVLVRDGSIYRSSGEFHAGDRIASNVLPGMELDPATIFGS